MDDPRRIFYLSFKGKFDKPAATFICRGNQAGGWHSLVQTKTKIAFGIKMHRGRDYLLIVILNTYVEYVQKARQWLGECQKGASNWFIK